VIVLGLAISFEFVFVILILCKPLVGVSFCISPLMAFVCDDSNEICVL
jgi:hypothetical protein